MRFLMVCAMLVLPLCGKGTSAGAKKAAVTRAASKASGKLVRVVVTNSKGKSVHVWRKL